MICERDYKYRKKCGYHYHFRQKHKTRFFTCLDYSYKDQGNFMYNKCDSDSFHGQGRYGIKWNFQHLPTGRTY